MSAISCDHVIMDCSSEESKRVALGDTRQPIAFADFDLDNAEFPSMGRGKTNHASREGKTPLSEPPNLLLTALIKHMKYAMHCQMLFLSRSLHQTHQALRLDASDKVLPCDFMGYISSGLCPYF